MLAAHYAPLWMMTLGFEAGFEAEVAAVNARRREQPELFAGPPARLVSAPGAEVAVLARGSRAAPRLVLVLNPNPDEASALPAEVVLPGIGGAGGTLVPLDEAEPAHGPIATGGTFEMGPPRLERSASRRRSRSAAPFPPGPSAPRRGRGSRSRPSDRSSRVAGSLPSASPARWRESKPTSSATGTASSPPISSGGRPTQRGGSGCRWRISATTDLRPRSRWSASGAISSRSRPGTTSSRAYLRTSPRSGRPG